MIRNAISRRRCIAHAWAAASVLVCAVLAVGFPIATAFYPVCPIHQFLGIECPGCGATRALSALLRGHLREALRFNALFILLLPIAIGVAIHVYRRAVQLEDFRWPAPPASVIYATLVIATLFTVARNIIH